jgi:hypothetical protein
LLPKRFGLRAELLTGTAEQLNALVRRFKVAV